jgi:hypothetical protein
VISQSNNWAAWIDGQLVCYTPYNTVSFGGSNLGNEAGAYFQGDIAEVLFFNRGLTADERNTVSGYLSSKFNLSQYAQDTFLPQAVTNVLAVGIAPYQLNLVWNAVTNTSDYHVERKLGSGGTYQEIGSIQTTFTNLIDTTAIATNTYFYRVRSHNLFGDVYSSAISPPAVGITNWPASLAEGTTSSVSAFATDANGSVVSVSLLANQTDIGTLTSAPYTATWIPTMEGPQALSAVAIDSLGNSQFSPAFTANVFLDSNGDGIPDYTQVSQGNDPLNPWVPPPVNTNDHSAPIIILTIPTNAVIVP